MNLADLNQHFFSTYASLRRGMWIIAFALPVALAGRLGRIEPSISHYYDDPRSRDPFVGLLFAIAICLFLYKGLTRAENIALNLAGSLLAGVALFPHTYKPWGNHVSPHGICAVTFFVTIAWVCWFCAKDSLLLIRDPELKRNYERLYKSIAVAMLASPLGAVAFNEIVGLNTRTFWIEVFAIYIFAVYWLAKGREIARIRDEGNAPDLPQGELAQTAGR